MSKECQIIVDRLALVHANLDYELSPGFGSNRWDYRIKVLYQERDIALEELRGHRR